MSKKSSWAPTRSRPKTSAQTDATISSTGPRGATDERVLPQPGLAREQAGPLGRPCRWASAAAPPAPRMPTGSSARGASFCKNWRSSELAGAGWSVRDRQIGDQATIVGHVLARHDRGLAHRGVPRERLLDLARLDPDSRES